MTEFKATQVVLKGNAANNVASNIQDLDNILNIWSRQGWVFHSMSTVMAGIPGDPETEKMIVTLVFSAK